MNDERLRRWRLILGEEGKNCGCTLAGDDVAIDGALGMLYDAERQAGLGASNPNIARWLGDIRTYFPASVVQVMQKDAIERLNLHQLLLEPEVLEMVEPDIHLVANLLSLNHVIPESTRSTARMVVDKLVQEVIRKLQNPMRQAIKGSLDRSRRNNRPHHHEINWQKTIQANLKHYLPEYKTIIPERLVGYGRKRTALKDVILCVDQSGSMATSVVYSGILGAVMASLPSLKTHLVVFDTAVVDLTEYLHDPVELLFGTRLGGGTDINQALSYCQGLVTRPTDTVFVLITDLYEGGNTEEMLRRAVTMHQSGIQLIVLLALNDDGAPIYDHHNAEVLASAGIPRFACTPDLFPDLMAAALSRNDIAQWAARHDIHLTPQSKGAL